MEFFISDLSSKCDQISRKLQITTLAGEILNGKHFLCDAVST